MTERTDILELVAEPREALDVEVKEWLDLSNPDQRASLAREIIALANHGGGYVVIGFRELADGSFQAATPRPRELNAWTQDAIQSVVAKYIDPNIQCRVVHQAASPAEERYPIIVVPGGHRVPIRAKSGSPDGKKLVPHRGLIARSLRQPRSGSDYWSVASRTGRQNFWPPCGPSWQGLSHLPLRTRHPYNTFWNSGKPQFVVGRRKLEVCLPMPHRGFRMATIR